MSQQPPSSVTNGSSSESTNLSLKDLQPHPQMTRSPNENGPSNTSTSPLPGFATRPPLARADSRTTLPPRPAFPQQQHHQQQQQQQLQQQQQQQPRPLIRPSGQPPIPGQFQQRPPILAPGPRPQQIFQQQQRPQINPNYRPPTPFPRPPQQQQQQQQQQPVRQIFQQRSFPSPQRPPLESPGPVDLLQRSQTLDSAIEINKFPHQNVVKMQDDVRARGVIQNRSYSMESEEERRRSIGSADGRGSVESLDRKSLEDSGSRPGSRIMMNRIAEDVVKSPEHGVHKSVDFKVASPVVTVPSKSPSPALVNNHKSANEVDDKIVVDKKAEVPVVVDDKNETKPVVVVENHDKSESKHLDLAINLNAKSPSRPEGDNDSGVDESTQGNDQSSNGSPRKSSGKLPLRTSSTTPTKNRSLSRGSKSPSSLKSPDSTVSTPGTTDKKKLPMNKIQVGSAPSPNLKVVRSKIGSLENTSYKPGGGKVKIENKKLDWNASTRIQAKNEKYTPKGGEKKIQQQKLQWNAKSKIGSLENASHVPKGGDKKIESLKLDFKDKAKPKVGSKDNLKHQPGGGDVKVETKKLDIKAQSKIGSLDNVKHKPGGGDKKIFDDKEYLKQQAENHSLSGSQNSLPSQPDVGHGSVADENLNQEH